MTVNVGIVNGGQSVNTTAPHAEGQIDLRYVKPADRALRSRPCKRSSTRPSVPGTTARLEILGEFLPLTTTAAAEELFAAYQAAAADAGLSIAGEFSGGCADSGFSAAVGCPTLCATGPVGAMRTRPRNIWRSIRWCRVPRRWRWRFCGCRLPPTAREWPPGRTRTENSY